MRRRSSVVLLASCFAFPIGVGGFAEGFSPGPDGWIRHWIVYGPIGYLPQGREQDRPSRHPVTLELLVTLDFIAEAEGGMNEKSFLPEPGKEIDTEFGVIVPDHVLLAEARSGLNPNGRPMGIGWIDCDCTVKFDSVFNFNSVHQDLVAGFDDINNYLAYAYTYIENVAGGDLEVLISLSMDDSAEVLFGHVPEIPGANFMSPVFHHDDGSGIAGDDCGEEEHGPNTGLLIPITIKPGFNLLLVKVLESAAFHQFRFRFRHADPERGYPPVTEGIRIRLSPDPGAPDPPLFKRMDANGDGAVDISDAVAGLLFLFGGENALRCPDAADADDDGELSVNDAVYTLSILFIEASRAHRPLFPYPCCGLDPTPDALDRFAASGACEYPGSVCE